MVNDLVVEMFWYMKDKVELKDSKFLPFITHKIQVNMIKNPLKSATNRKLLCSEICVMFNPLNTKRRLLYFKDLVRTAQ